MSEMIGMTAIEAMKTFGPTPEDIMVLNPQDIHYKKAYIISEGNALKLTYPRRYPGKSHQLVRAQDVLAGANEAIIIVSPTSYEAFLSSEWRWGINAPSPLSVAALTFTSDGYLVLGQRSQNVGTEPEQTHLIPAGYMEWSDIKGSKIYEEPHRYTLTRELQEELGIRKYAEAIVLGIVNRWTVDNPMIVFALRLIQNRDRLLTLWSKRQEKLHKEHFGLVFVKSEDIIPWWQEHKLSLAEHLHSALLLYKWSMENPSFYVGGEAIDPLTTVEWVSSFLDQSGQLIGQLKYKSTKGIAPTY